MHGYASQLAERVFSQLPVFLSAIKLEGKENKPEREATRLEAFKLIFITVVYVAQISLDESDFSRFIDCFKIVRFLTKTCLSSEDVFPAYIISSLRTMAMKASEVVEQESEISMIILNDYSRECLELEAMRDENEAIQNNGYLSAGIIVDRARSESHLIESDKPIKVKDLKSSCIIHEQKIKTRATEQSISRQSSIKIIPEVKNLVQNPADMTLKCHLKSFVSITKKHKQKNINSGPPTKQTDQSRPYHNMDQYFQMTMEKRLPAESIPNISYLDGYDKTFTKERKYWLANFTAKNSFNNVKAVKTQSKDMQSLVDANFKHTKVMIKIDKCNRTLSLIGKRKQSAEIAKPKANLHRQETEAENTWMGSELLQIIRRNKFDLNLTSFFKVKHHHAAVRSTDDNECMDRLTKLGDNVEYRLKKVLPKRHVLEANDIIRKNVTQLKAEERHLTKSYSMMKTKRRSLSSDGCEPVDSHGIRRNKSFSSKLEKSQLAKSLVGIYNTPYEFRLLSKIINNLKRAGKVREDRRVTVLTTDVSEIEHSRSHSNKITPPNFSQLIGSYTTK